MTPQERDDLTRDIARRVLAERESGRPVDPERISWAEEALRNAEPPTPRPRVSTPEAA